MYGCAKFKEQGFTLIELIVAIVVFAVSFSMLVTVLNPAIEGSANPVLQIRAAEVGQAYMEEIIAKRFDENSAIGSQPRCGEATAPACSAVLGPDGGETRVSYDDVDDYHNLTEVPTDALGNARASYASYQVSITVAYAGGDLALAGSDAKRIDLVVTGPVGARFEFSVYKTNF